MTRHITWCSAMLALFLASAPLRGSATEPGGSNVLDKLHPPALNHLYIVLDAETFAAIRDSRELAAVLGRPDGGLPGYAAPADNADRLFFRGRQTYIELFAPQNRFGEPVGKIGLALGHDRPERLDRLASAWQASCGAGLRRTAVEWRRAQPPVPWYDAVQCDATAANPHLVVWAMTYRPEFVRWQAGPGTEGRALTSRADVLAPRGRDGQGRFDIAELAIDVPSALHASLVAQLERAGITREDISAGTRLQGDGWGLLLRDAGTSANGAAMTIEMETQGTPAASLLLGSSRITRHRARTVRWEFETKPGLERQRGM